MFDETAPPDAHIFVANKHAQRVHVIGPHLLDGSLPYDLWTHEAELAAIVYIVMQRPDLEASTALPSIIRQYNESNARIGISTMRFHATLTEFYIRAVRFFIDTLPRKSYPGAVYASLLGCAVAMPDFSLHFYSSRRLVSSRAYREVVEPDILPLTRDTLRAHLWRACA